MENSVINQKSPDGMKSMFDFLQKLATHNNKAWFEKNKSEYDSLRKVFVFMVDELINEIATFDPRIIGTEAKNCIFRIYRDVRFSSDKRPYKTHFGAWIAPGGRKSNRPGYYLHIEPNRCLLAAGIWHTESALLKEIRTEIVDDYSSLKKIIEYPAFERTFDKIQGSTLKTFPKGFSKDFPDPYLLQLKEYFVEHYVPDSFFNEQWLTNARDILKIAYPLNKFLDKAVEGYNEDHKA